MASCLICIEYDTLSRVRSSASSSPSPVPRDAISRHGERGGGREEEDYPLPSSRSFARSFGACGRREFDGGSACRSPFRAVSLNRHPSANSAAPGRGGGNAAEFT